MKLVKLLLFLVVIALLALLGAGLFADALVAGGVEAGATYALGVDTTLDSASVGLTSGELTLGGLSVANPAGFEADHFFAMEHAHVAVSLGSLMEDTVRVPAVQLSGLDVVLENAGGKSNYQVILDNLGRFESGEAKAPGSAPAGDGKQFVIELIEIKDVSVTANVLPLGGNLSRTTLTIPEIRLENVGSGGEGMSLAEVVNLVVKSVLGAVAHAGVNLPGNLAGELQKGLSGLADIDAFGAQVVGQIGAQVGEVGGKLGEALGEAGGKATEAVGEAAGKVGEALGGLGGLLGGKPDDGKKKKDG